MHVKRLAYTALFITVLCAGITLAAVTTLCEDTAPDW